MTEEYLQYAVESMILTDRMHRFMFDSHVDTIGIHRTQHRILMYLARHEKLLSQKELADHLSVSPAAITFSLKKLISDGYIEKSLGADNRFYELSITPLGKKIVLETRKAFSYIDREMFSGFTDEELIQYTAFQKKIQQNIKKMQGMKGEDERWKGGLNT